MLFYAHSIEALSNINWIKLDSLTAPILQTSTKTIRDGQLLMSSE